VSLVFYAFRFSMEVFLYNIFRTSDMYKKDTVPRYHRKFATFVCAKILSGLIHFRRETVNIS